MKDDTSNQASMVISKIAVNKNYIHRYIIKEQKILETLYLQGAWK